MNDSNCIFARIFRDDIDIGDSEWSDVIQNMDFLEPMPDRKGINPFTSEEEMFSGAGRAAAVNGTRIEWHVPSEETAGRVRAIFARQVPPITITVVVTPE